MAAARLPERYRDPERVARGGMGEIYRAEDTVLGRVVAIKVLSEPYADDEGTRRRFTREARAAARLSNAPNAVTIFDVGEHEGRPYIVMEYLPGGSLADRLAAEGAQAPGRALTWLAQAAAALDAAHEKGVVHRDVKPANLLLDDAGNVHVADFGIASAAGLDSFTAAGTVLGTAGYLSPEQARGERAGPAADRYALGVVAYELLTGSRPFERESSTAEAAAHVTAPVPPASSLNAELPPEVDRVLDRALAKDPEARPASCADLVGALREALHAAAGGTVVREAATAPVAARAPGPVPPPAGPPPRRSRLPLVLGAVLLLGLLGAALALALGRGDEEDAGGTTPATQQETVQPTTVQQTITAPGTTIVETVTTQAEPEPPPEETTPTQPQSGGSPSALNDEGFRLMQAGDYAGALPLLEQAVAGASGSGSLTEAYASYNLANTRFQLGRCDGVLELLDRSEAIQGSRSEITRLRAQAQERCGDDD